MFGLVAGSLGTVTIVLLFAAGTPSTPPLAGAHWTGSFSPRELFNPYNAESTFGGCGECLGCIGGPPIGFAHVWCLLGWGPTWGEDHCNTCYVGGCDHPSGCGGFGLRDSAVPETGEGKLDQDVAAAEEAILDGGLKAAGAVLALMRLYPERVTLNVGRNALQVTALCSPARIAANIPLSASVMKAIVSQLESD